MIRKILISITLVFVAVSCTKDFEKINIDPNKPAAVPLDYLLGQSQLSVAGSNDLLSQKTWRVNFANAGCISQQLSSTDAGFYGGSFYTSASNNYSAFFDNAYPNAIKNLVNLIDLAKTDQKNVNVLSMARILKVMEFARITDLYGDVPYFDAGKGYIDANFNPKYDSQKDIYMDMLKELDEAGTALNSTAYIPTKADYVYAGDITKWKKAANTLMLRLALRLQKVDATSAKTWATKAISGGLISGANENIAIGFDGSGSQMNANPNSYILGPSGQNIAGLNGLLWGKTLIDMMKNRLDPRLSIIACLKNGDTNVANQRGLPNGTDANGLTTLPETNLSNYSRPTASMYKTTNSWIYMTYAESQLLLAEAIERGYASGSATNAFIIGQASGVNQVSVYGTTPSSASVTAYAVANPYPGTTLDDKLNAIHTEIYLIHAVTFNHIEAWANWRRTGYPVLTAVNPVGNETNGTIPRRLKYSANEFGVNANNINEAITRQGADLFTTKIWWDK